MKRNDVIALGASLIIPGVLGYFYVSDADFIYTPDIYVEFLHYLCMGLALVGILIFLTGITSKDEK